MSTLQSLQHHPVVTALVGVLGDPIYMEHADEVRFNSPFTSRFKEQGRADRKHHLYVNPIKGKFIDYKSSTAGSLEYLFNLLGLDTPSEAPPQQEDLGSLRSRLMGLDSGTLFARPLASLPEWFRPITCGGVVHRYLHERGVGDSDIDFYHIGEGSGGWLGWVIIPSYRGGVCEYWVARDTRRKVYQNPSVHRRHHLVFLGQALQESPDHVVVCEGVFSALGAGRDAVAALGKFVTDAQLHLIADAGVRTVTLALDSDAWDETLDTAARCLRIGLETNVVPLPTGMDPGDLGRDAFAALRASATFKVTPESLIRLRLMVL